MSVLDSLAPVVAPIPPLFVPPDVFEDGEDTSAHCGPCAIAALLGKTLAEVRDSGTPLRKSMNVTEANAALHRLGRAGLAIDSPHRSGIAHVMWDGPWTAAGPRVAYRYSHWIAYRQVAGILAVYDINAGEAGAWLTFPEWEQNVVPLLLPKRGTGYHVNKWIEVRLDWPIGSPEHLQAHADAQQGKELV